MFGRSLPHRRRPTLATTVAAAGVKDDVGVDVAVVVVGVVVAAAAPEPSVLYLASATAFPWRVLNPRIL